MTRFAWIENNVIRDIAPAGDPTQFYHPDIAINYSIEVPDDAENGDTFSDGVLTKRPIPVPPTYVPPPPPPPPAWEWLIDIGPFYDRFGAAKMAVLTSADAGVKAILQDVQVRKWIDLERADVAQSLAYIGTKVPAVDATLQAAIIGTPVAPEENLALRKMYFS
jgi:hypothetical protein